MRNNVRVRGVTAPFALLLLVDRGDANPAVPPLLADTICNLTSRPRSMSQELAVKTKWRLGVASSTGIL